MKDLVIGGFSGNNADCPNIWIESLVKSGFSGDIVLIAIGCPEGFADKIYSDAIVITKPLINDSTSIYSQRFYHIYNYLLKKRNYRYVITTDVTDVYFQSDPVKIIEKNIEDKKLLLSSESILFKDSQWNIQNVLDSLGDKDIDFLLDKEVHNVGIIAGEQKYVRSIIEDVYNLSKRANSHPCDQSIFNVLINKKPYKDITKSLKIEDQWVCNCAVMFDAKIGNEFNGKKLSGEPKIINNIITDESGYATSIIHQYNRSQELLDIVYSKYLK